MSLVCKVGLSVASTLAQRVTCRIASYLQKEAESAGGRSAAALHGVCVRRLSRSVAHLSVPQSPGTAEGGARLPYVEGPRSASLVMEDGAHEEQPGHRLGRLRGDLKKPWHSEPRSKEDAHRWRVGQHLEEIRHCDTAGHDSREARTLPMSRHGRRRSHQELPSATGPQRHHHKERQHQFGICRQSELLSRVETESDQRHVLAGRPFVPSTVGSA